MLLNIKLSIKCEKSINVFMVKIEVPMLPLCKEEKIGVVP